MFAQRFIGSLSRITSFQSSLAFRSAFRSASFEISRQIVDKSKWHRFGKYFGAASIFGMSCLLQERRARSDEIINNQFDELDSAATFFATSQNPEKPTVKILVVDGGGLRGCMSMQILKALEEAIHEEPGGENLLLDQVFDMIVGVSTGGLIALGIGKLHWDCQKIDDFYDRMASLVFGKDAGFIERWISKPIWSVGSAIGVTTALDTDKLEDEFKTVFEKRDMNMDDEMIKEPFINVIATMENNYLLSTPVLIKNYDLGHNGFMEFLPETDYHLPSLSECKIWEAARATTAAPTYFKPCDIRMPKNLQINVVKSKLSKLMGLYLGEPNNKEIIDILTKKANNIFDIQDEHEKENMINDLVDGINEHKNKDIIKTDIKKKDVMDSVYNTEYKLKFVDGGINTNAPCLFAYTEAYRMWPDCNIKMLAVGTGRPPENELYDIKKEPTVYLQKIFEIMFRGKEFTTLLPLISLAAIDNLDLQRMNPEIDPSKTDMADTSLMEEWRNTGKNYAKLKNNDIKNWAKFLVEQQKQNNHQKVIKMFDEIKNKFPQRIR